jgi:hypothetical protein
MAGSLFFVHGTGVRQAGYERTMEKLRAGTKRVGLEDIALPECSWGEAFGVHFDRVAETLPGHEVSFTELEKSPSSEDLERAVWAYLLEDPLFELRAAASTSIDGNAGQVQAQAIVTEVVAFNADRLDLEGTELTPINLSEAAAAIGEREELSRAASTVDSAVVQEVPQMIARAIVAQALANPEYRQPGMQPTAALKTAVRDRLVRQIVGTIAPSAGLDSWESESLFPSWMVNWLLEHGLRPLLPLITAYARDHRQEFTVGTAAPFAGDVLYYLRRGKEIVEFVANRLREAEPPVVAIGHSLGGIILVDLLSRPQAPKIDYLITAGSQSPVLFAIDALECLRLGKPLTSLPPWLNIYDRDDLISFLAAEVFGPNSNIRDEEVSSGLAFPISHSAYWANDRVYELILDCWNIVHR